MDDLVGKSQNTGIGVAKVFLPLKIKPGQTF